tara:strand:- start:209 stop:445 length:237 start_codon:yes stop_codon:yes gene_type:complete
MDNLLLSGIISAVFVVLKVMDTKYISKNDMVTKYVIKDGTMTFVSVLLTTFLVDKFNLFNVKSVKDNKPGAFTDAPGF